MRSPKEVEKEQYQEFYKKTFSEFLDPLAYTHFTTEVQYFLLLIGTPVLYPPNYFSNFPFVTFAG